MGLQTEGRAGLGLLRRGRSRLCVTGRSGDRVPGCASSPPGPAKTAGRGDGGNPPTSPRGTADEPLQENAGELEDSSEWKGRAGWQASANVAAGPSGPARLHVEQNSCLSSEPGGRCARTSRAENSQAAPEVGGRPRKRASRYQPPPGEAQCGSPSVLRMPLARRFPPLLTRARLLTHLHAPPTLRARTRVLFICVPQRHSTKPQSSPWSALLKETAAAGADGTTMGEQTDGVQFLSPGADHPAGGGGTDTGDRSVRQDVRTKLRGARTRVPKPSRAPARPGTWRGHSVLRRPGEGACSKEGTGANSPGPSRNPGS